MTRLEALNKAAELLGRAEGTAGEQSLSKYLTLAQLYMTLGHELTTYEDTAAYLEPPVLPFAHDPAA